MQIQDQHEGTVVCISCARVMDIYLEENGSGLHNEKRFVSHLEDVAENNHINTGIQRDAAKILAEVRAKLPKRNVLEVEFFSLFSAALKSEYPYLLSEVTSMFGYDLKTASKIMRSISKATNYQYADTDISNPLRYLDRLGCNILSSREIAKIGQLYNEIALIFAHKSPRLFIAAIIYNYMKRNSIPALKKDHLLNKLAKQFAVNCRSIKSLEKEIDAQFEKQLT